MIVMMLDKANWDIIGKESPNSFKKFMDYVDDFKKSCNWDELFNNPRSKEHKTLFINFHEIPFAMQKGIIQNFLLEEHISFYPLVIEDTDPVKWSFHTVDLTKGKIMTKTINPGSSIPFEYNFSEEAEVAAIGVAFQMLNDEFLKNLN